jgi:DNA gyrase subunit B
VGGAAPHPGGDVPPITGVGLEGLMDRYAQVRRHFQRLRHRLDSNLLEALVDLPCVDEELWSDQAAMREWAEGLQSRLADPSLDRPRYVVRYEHEDGVEDVFHVERRFHGLVQHLRLGRGFFFSQDYEPIGELARDLAGLMQADAQVHRGARSQEVRDFQQAYEWLISQAQRNREISRFKGLGEMNPDQLWETTVNPDTRRLIQVTVEDAVAADTMFSMLMGEAVEPRRLFIETNALKVANLDV